MEGNGRNPTKLTSAIMAVLVIVALALVVTIPECGPEALPDPAATGSGGAQGEPASSEAPAVAASAEGYVLRFPQDFKPALAARDDLGISVVIAIDVSGSMRDSPAAGGGAKFEQASQALLEVCDLIEKLYAKRGGEYALRVGILKFNDKVTELMPLTTIERASLSRVRETAGTAAGFEPGGETAIGLAIERGVGMLAQSGTVMRSLIIVSDGMNTSGVHPSEVLEAVYANRNSAATRDFPVYTNATLISFIGFDLESGVFAPFGGLGARVATAQNRKELVATLENLLIADVTKLEAPSLGGGK